MARAFLDQQWQWYRRSTLTDGTQTPGWVQDPRIAFVMLEMFKFRNGKLYRAEVVHAGYQTTMQVPFGRHPSSARLDGSFW